jgi:hypothetical protein
LGPHEALTITVGFPAGAVPAPHPDLQEAQEAAGEGLPALAAAVALALAAIVALVGLGRGWFANLGWNASSGPGAEEGSSPATAEVIPRAVAEVAAEATPGDSPARCRPCGLGGLCCPIEIIAASTAESPGRCSALAATDPDGRDVLPSGIA